ncbi:MAG: YbhB/YbcL family Raf kinase inhibitor-like protein [Candidatus Vogelbacteria bacterium]|nr:YbhB/YbcL family Raf kinase inhibitor-like protein [Candidatus Vogelbacteria bacterium]
MNIKSTVFDSGGKLPAKYTCDGGKTNPPLEISNVPVAAKSLVLIVEDPDAPRSIYAPDGVWVHWLVWNIDPRKNVIKENEEAFGVVGSNSYGHVKYDPPCPPNGEHHYFFRVFALDTLLDLSAGSTKDKLVTAINGHIVASSELLGRYSRY